MINVTKTFLPPQEEYMFYLQQAWDRAWITNNGPLVQELEAKLKAYLGVKHLFFCGNGTIVLQMAIKALGLKKEILTTPFSYVATTTTILWENCTPVFVDINPHDFNIDADKIEAAITPNTEAILATHVYGNPCDIKKIEAIAKKHNLKVIYDGAHCFGATYEGKQILSFGDIATCSFHATKVFHTVEGGCLITNDDEVARKLYLYRQFGHVNDDYFSVGINGKNSEFHAAMGLAILPHIDDIIAKRKKCTEIYRTLLAGLPIQFAEGLAGTAYNYAYFPVILPSEAVLLQIRVKLAEQQINTRRYFYPSLNVLDYLDNKSYHCPVSEDVSVRALSLPLFYDLAEADIHRIVEIIKNNLNT